jgi:hypothetical protein
MYYILTAKYRKIKKEESSCEGERGRRRGKGGERTQPQVKWILASFCTKLAITACNLYKIQ